MPNRGPSAYALYGIRWGQIDLAEGMLAQRRKSETVERKHSTIVVKDLESGEVDAVEYKPDLR